MVVVVADDVDLDCVGCCWDHRTFVVWRGEGAEEEYDECGEVAVAEVGAEVVGGEQKIAGVA